MNPSGLWRGTHIHMTFCLTVVLRRKPWHCRYFTIIMLGQYDSIRRLLRDGSPSQSAPMKTLWISVMWHRGHSVFRESPGLFFNYDFITLVQSSFTAYSPETKRVHELRVQEVLNAVIATDFEVGIFILPTFVYSETYELLNVWCGQIDWLLAKTVKSESMQNRQKSPIRGKAEIIKIALFLRTIRL